MRIWAKDCKKNNLSPMIQFAFVADFRATFLKRLRTETPNVTSHAHGSDETALDEVFGYFDGIEGRAAQQLVAAHEHVEPLLVVARDVLANASR